MTVLDRLFDVYMLDGCPTAEDLQELVDHSDVLDPDYDSFRESLEGRFDFDFLNQFDFVIGWHSALHLKHGFRYGFKLATLLFFDLFDASAYESFLSRLRG